MSRINTNVSALNAHRNLSHTNMMLGKSIQKLSSGFRINSSADDAAGLAIANRLRSDQRSLVQASRNATQASAMLQVADGAINTVSTILDRMKELASQSNSDNIGNQRTALNAEYQQLIAEIDRIAATTTYQGTALVNGAFTGSFMVSSSGNYATTDLVSVTAIDVTSATILGATPADITSAANAQTALGEIDLAQGAMATAIGNVGATLNRIEFAAANAASLVQNTAAAESVVRDADMAQEMVSFTKFQILQQAGTAMLAQANGSAQSVLSLLRG